MRVGHEPALALVGHGDDVHGGDADAQQRQVVVQNTLTDARHERGVDIVDVGMFDWQAMVRFEVRSMGVDIDEALRFVAVETGPRLAALINVRTKQASSGIKGVQRVLLLLVAAAIGFVYLAVVQNAGRSF